MNPIRLLTVAGALLAGIAAATAQTLALPPGYRLVWSDEFSHDGLPDPARWRYETSQNRVGWYNHELQYYAAERPANTEVRQGRLLITARHETLDGAPDWGGQRYTSGRLSTQGKAAWRYGFFEVRARMPCGLGTWPAIWMVGAGGHWPDDGELDILEHIGSHPSRVSSAVHTLAGHGGDSVSGTALLPDACSAFHDYQMLWTHEGVSFGVDGVPHWHYARNDRLPGAWPFDAPQFLILNLAIGGDLGGPVDDAIFPVVMQVEHVRVWQGPQAGSSPRAPGATR